MTKNEFLINIIGGGLNILSLLFMRKKIKKTKIRGDTSTKTKRTFRRKKINKNKKVCNARITEKDDIVFRSALEAYTHDLLVGNNIPHTYEKEIFPLIPSFIYRDEKIRAATYKPDFVGDTWIIEVKGYATDVFKLRWKLFKYTLAQKGINYTLYLPKNQEQVREAVTDILKNIELARAKN